MELKVESGDPWRGSTCRGRCYEESEGLEGREEGIGQDQVEFLGSDKAQGPG